MRIDDKVRKTVVFVGQASGSLFTAIGTAFIGLTFINDAGFQQLITAKHVIDRIAGDIVYVRVNRQDGRAQIIETEKAMWHSHPDKRLDISVSPTHIPKDVFDIIHLPLDPDGGLIPSDEAIRNAPLE
jgi:hypothetical protein